MKPSSYYINRPTISRWSFLIWAIVQSCIFLTMIGPTLRRLEIFELLVNLAGIVLAGSGVHYLLVKRTKDFNFDEDDGKVRDKISKGMSQLNKTGRIITDVNRHDDLCRQALGSLMICAGAFWFFMPWVSQLPHWMSIIFLAAISIVFITACALVLPFEHRMRE